MIEYIKNIFDTPHNLWTLPQELTVFAMVVIAALVGFGLFIACLSARDFVRALKRRRKAKKRKKEKDNGRS